MNVSYLKPRVTGSLAAYLLAAVFCGAISVVAQSVSNGYWQAQSIYQIITDRFYDGDPSNNNADGNYNPSGTTSVHGGDFRGIEDKLNYIKSLGATAIWISPIVVNANGEFHGYAGRDFYNVDPHWGSLADLQHLVQAAHARGLLVIDDIIVNHGGDLIYSTDSGYANFKYPPDGYNLRYRNTSKQFAVPFNTNAANPNLTNLFHNNGAIQNYSDQTQVELGELSGLDDFRTESPYIRSNMVAVYDYWIQQAGFDGFRIDTVKHVDMGFWQTWCPAVHAFAATNGLPNFFMFGEVYDGSDAKCGSYTGTEGGGVFKLDSVVDYPLYFLVNSVFATASGNTAQIENRYAALPGNYDPSAQNRLVTFLDNHDQARFLSPGNANDNADRLKVALVFLYTARGIPCLYYGTEQGFDGTTDPNDREDMFDGQFEQGPSLGDNFNMTHPLFQWIARLNNFRRLYPALTLGVHSNEASNPSGPGLLVYSRQLGSTQEVFVALNTASSTQIVPSRATIYPVGTTLINLLDTNESVTVVSGSQTPPISVPATSAKIFIAQSQMLPLDPAVTSVSPVHDATGVSATTPLVIQFSKPMDTNSVMAAFSTTPVVSGNFAWSANRDTMTFTPVVSWPGLTLVTARIGDTAHDAVSGNIFYAGFESRFTTATASDLVPPVVTLQSPTNNAFVAGLLTISGTATDNLAVQKVEVRLDTNAWSLATGATTWSYSLNTSNFLNGSHIISARATDTGGNVSSTNSVTVRFVNVPGSYLQRMSGGNPSDVTDCNGNLWLKDAAYAFGAFGYSGGTTGYLNNAISGICPSAQSLYQRERYSTSANGFYYQFDCPEGIYEVTLLESETYWSGVGQRVFNAYIQGRQVLTNFDIYAVTGGQNIPLSLVFTNAVTNSQLQILFMPVVDNARVSGVQVRKIADVFSDTDGIPDWWRLAYFGHALGMAGDQSRSSDDKDGDGVSNLTEFLNGTDPLNPISVPPTPVFNTTGVVLMGNDVRVSFTTVTNWTFQLQRSDSLSNISAWIDVGPTESGTGGILTLTDVGSATNVTRFYRIHAN